MKLTLLIHLLLIECVSIVNSAVAVTNAETPEYWRSKARLELERKISEHRNENVAKNVILFLGDGMSIPTVTAGRIYKGQRKGHTGEDTTLSFEKFPTTGLSKTYNQNRQVTDSAASATAFLCGIKTNQGMVGVDGTVQRGDCQRQRPAELTSIVDWSLAAGKSIGLVTTTSITSATIASSFANVADRYWENDADLRNVTGNCRDITAQLIEDYPQIQVILGGGRKHFLRNNMRDPESREFGRRQDGRDLIAEWKTSQLGLKRRFKYVWNDKGFRAANANTPDSVLGLFAFDNMNFDLTRKNPKYEKAGEPSISEMTELAIKVLSKNPKGFFLLVEGGRIDHAHHLGIAKLALHDFLAFEKAVAVGNRLTNQNDSLIVVTADHSHTMTFSGYPDRGNDILGKVKEGGRIANATDGKPYTTLLYGNGPGYSLLNGERADLTHIDTASGNHYRQQAAVPLFLETHGGDDVGIWSRGPMSHLLSGTHEQNYIAHVMAYASCVGQYTSKCLRPIQHRVQ